MKKVRWFLFFAWVLMTVFLCAQDGGGSGELSSLIAGKIYARVSFFRSNFLFDDFHHLFRKFTHFFVHFMLAFFCFRAVQTDRKRTLSAFLAALLLSSSLAAFDEAVQIIATDRGPRSFDLALNIFGATTGTFFSVITFRKQTF